MTMAQRKKTKKIVLTIVMLILAVDLYLPGISDGDQLSEALW